LDYAVATITSDYITATMTLDTNVAFDIIELFIHLVALLTSSHRCGVKKRDLGNFRIYCKE
jgi:hypothetical protein